MTAQTTMERGASVAVSAAALAPVAAPPAAAAPAHPDRLRSLERDTFDVIIIGSGMGGLTAAALLARSGRSVLVLERHYVAGGHASVFHRRGYEFDVGIHCLGDCGPDGDLPRMLSAAGAEGVTFREMDPDAFDTLVFPNFVFRVPRGIETYRARLIERFPDEVRGIDRYVGLLRGVWSLHKLGAGGPGGALRAAWRARSALVRMNSTLGRFLDSCTRDQKLRAVLCAQSGLYAEPPSRAALATHAMVMAGYLHGAYYPAGGAQVISDRLAASIERHGGRLLLMTEVTSVVVEDGGVTGVEAWSHHLGRLRLRAPVVISDADLKHTLLGLVDRVHLKARTLKRTRAFEMSPALGVVYLGVKRDLRAEGFGSTNFWISPKYSPEPLYAAARAGHFHPEPFCYLSSTTLKDPDNARAAPAGVTNIQLMTIVPSSPEAWSTTAGELASGAYHANAEYRRMKEAFATCLLGVAERAFPGLSRDVVYREVATPLTHSRKTGSSGGTGYGLAAIPRQILFRRPGAATEVKGLYLCGASTTSGHGIIGTMWSGVTAARRVVGGKALQELMARSGAPAGRR